jgi:desulfoferrodoxin (superoxide reductase-like protein)
MKCHIHGTWAVRGQGIYIKKKKARGTCQAKIKKGRIRHGTQSTAHYIPDGIRNI